jgi:FkbM family methyltransferase
MKGINRYNLKILSQVFSGKSYNFDLHSVLPEHSTIVDIGANIGAFTLSMNALMPKSSIYSVEPDIVCFNNLMANTLGTSVKIFNIALTNENGMADLYKGGFDSVSSSIAHGAMTTGDVQRVNTQEMSEYLNFVQNDSGRSIDVLKIDAEGAEWYLLKCMNIVSDISIIHIEYHSAKFLELFLVDILRTHILCAGEIRFPHRGELSFVRKNLISKDQSSFEIII